MTSYRTASIDGLEIFYREAGSRSNPTILLLHGYPTSSHMLIETDSKCLRTDRRDPGFFTI